jgi:hypothetical protein
MPTRTPEEIRASIEQNRLELGQSIEKLRVEVQELTDWRSQLKRNQDQLVMVAAGTGFVLGGGIGGAAGLVFGYPRRRRRRKARRVTKRAAKGKR